MCALTGAVALAVACGGNATSSAGAASQAGPGASASTDAYGTGLVTGTMTFEGAPPVARPLRMDSDPLCAPEPGTVSERVVVGPGGGLANVFVYVKDGLGGRTYEAPATPVELN
ncbi:MAG: hypothetical protein AB7I50_25020, partial [Vicinamibacterales bacterium]